MSAGRFTVFVALVTASCIAGPPEPRDSTVEVEISGHFGDWVDPALRWAVVWVDTMRFNRGRLIVADEGGPIGDATQLTLPLRIPEELDELPWSSLSVRNYEIYDPVTERVEIVDRITLAGVAVARPFLLLYADVDGNRRFEPTLLDATGPDRVQAINHSSVGAFVDLLDALARLRTEDTADYY